MIDFDAIVVGSGISGGWAAKELTERGLKVLLIERGRMVRHGEDYPNEHRAPWDYPFRQFGDRRASERDYPVQSRMGNFSEGSQPFFLKDADGPYRTEDGTDFTWIRGDQLGGRSLIWGRYAFRYGESNFTDNLRDGRGVDWPIRYADLAPWYDHVEKFAGISGTAAGLAHVPDSQFMPPLPLNCVEEHVAAAIKTRFGRHLLPARAAILTQDLGERSACHFCGPCLHGCSTGSYFSSQSSTLPAALATGRLTIRTDTLVEGVDHDPKTGRATGVRVIDRATGAFGAVTARVIFLNASTIATAQILLNSTSAAFPTGLANGSGELGRNLMDHVLGPRATGRFDAFAGVTATGNRPSGVGMFIARFRNVGDDASPFLRGYHYQGSASRQAWPRGANAPGIGLSLKAELRTPGPWTMFVGGLGECLPNPDNHVTLDPQAVDRWGIPQPRIQFGWTDNERAMAVDMAKEAGAMLAAAGATDIKTSADLSPPGSGVHEAGTARMGRDPKTSVLNGQNQAHEVPNLFVTDGACLPSSPNQNPSLTYMALSARAAAFAVDQLKQGIL
jgi:choline dehydrogenase-like flavoprotein